MPDQNLFLRDLPPPVLERIRPRLRAQIFTPGQVLFASGEPVAHIYFMRSGAVSLVCELSGGPMIGTAMVGRDGAVGAGAALDDRPALHKAIVQIAGTGFALDGESARRVARESEDFRAAIVRHEQLLMAQAQQSAACNACHSLNERLARWLLRTRDVLGSDEFQLTQEFMAEMLGVRRTSVSIVAHVLQQAGLISYRRGHIRIEKPEVLERGACECYAAIRMRYAALIQQAPAFEIHAEALGGVPQRQSAPEQLSDTRPRN